MRFFLSSLAILLSVTNSYAQEISPLLSNSAPALNVAQGLPVTVSNDDKTINTSVNPGEQQRIRFTVHNNVSTQPSVPILGITGFSGFISRVSNDAGYASCGSSLAKNQSCYFTLLIAPQLSDAGTRLSSSVNVNYGGMYPACYPQAQCNGSFTVAVRDNLATLAIDPSPAPLLMVGGLPKEFTILNTSTSYPARNLNVTLFGNTGVTVAMSSCGATLPANSSCTVELAPPSVGAEAGQPAFSGTLSVSASNVTITASETFYLLNYANIYNDGYIYALNDNTPTTSLTGAVAATADLTVSGWGTRTIPVNKSYGGEGSRDGAEGNMSAMLNADPTLNLFPAAKACYDYHSSDNLDHWYLPAICEFGGAGQGAGCTNSSNNMVTELLGRGIGGFSIARLYWSSTEYDYSNGAWYQSFYGSAAQSYDYKTSSHIVRCARAISYPNT